MAIIEAPSTLGLTSSGVERLPEALIGARLVDRLCARRAGRVDPPPAEPRRDPETLVLNPRPIAQYTVVLADAIGEVLNRDEFPLALGGDCTILLASLLALRRRGRYGLLFLDGHADFYQPEAEPKGEAASMELALATGRGPPILSAFEGFCPLVRDEDVVVLGRRDAADAEAYGSRRIEETGIAMIELERIRRDGLQPCLDQALERLARPELDGFWLHLDADVLDDAIMPAVDYRMEGGLGWQELEATLSAARASGRLEGMHVTIFNPELDTTGTIAGDLADALVRSLR